MEKVQQFLQRMISFGSSNDPEASSDVDMADEDAVDYLTTRQFSTENTLSSRQNQHIDAELLIAACRGDVITVRNLIYQGADIETQGKKIC